MLKNNKNLISITPPEEIIFEFFGKIGSYFLTWREGQWIITNRRLIFISKSYYPHDNKSFFHYFMRPLILVLPLGEIKSIVKKERKVVIKYHLYYHYGSAYKVRKLKIGFFRKNFRNYRVDKRSELINKICDYLKDPDQIQNISYCPECGNKVVYSDDYCTNCGNYLKD
ncbi:MAG: hypothetical protein GF329_02575 [Candidatus Lokiarchaeota archaeon]|nr:hypothetical protein [Candidatus Lokiarchaeota archaeon]